MRKTMLVLLFLLFLLGTASIAFAADEGVWQRADCATDITSPVAGKTWCRQTTTAGAFNAGDVLKYDGAWKLIPAQAVQILTSTVAGLPASPTEGTIRIVTDGADDTDCDTGAGVLRVICEWDGTGWGARGSGAGTIPTLDQAFDQGKVIDGAPSAASAFRVGNADIKWLIYCTGTNECFIETSPASNSRQRIQTDKTGGFYDVEGASDIFTIDPDAASVNAMYSFAAAYRPLNSALLSMSSDGTQCAAPAEVTVGSWGKMWTTICTDNDASVMTGTISSMPNKWDGGTIKVTMSVVQDAVDTGALHADVSARCVASGAAPAAYGTEVALDIAAVTGSDALNRVTSAAVTPSGTCAGGNLLQFQIAVDAVGTTTAMATLHFLDPKVEYSVSSLSD